MRRTSLVVAISAIALAAAVSALAAPVPGRDNFTGKFDKKSDKGAVMGLVAVYKNGKIRAVSQFDRDGFTCKKGQRSFVGAIGGPPFKVKGDAFHGSRPVSGAGPYVSANIRGDFIKNGRQAEGRVKLGGPCNWKNGCSASGPESR